MIKICKCCKKTFIEIPENAKEVYKDHIDGGGWMWQCGGRDPQVGSVTTPKEVVTCGNTLYLPNSKLNEIQPKGCED